MTTGDRVMLNPMLQRKLGNASGSLVGAVGLGCMSFAGFYGETTREESMSALQRAAELGVTHLDTAIIYGNGLSESIIGEFTTTSAHRFVIASKCGIEVTAEGRSFNNTRDYVRGALEGSLERLQTDHIELYYLHRRDPNVEIEDAMETMAALVEEKLIGGIGLSEVAPSTLERAAAVHPVAAIQSEYSLWTRLPELGLLQACERLGTAFVAFSPVGRGALTDIPPDPATFGERDFRHINPRFSPEHYRANRVYLDKFRDYARERGWNAAALAVAWTLAQGPHIISIPGTRSAGHLEELVEGGTIELDATTLAEIETILPIGFAHGNRYSWKQIVGTELYC